LSSFEKSSREGQFAIQKKLTVSKNPGRRYWKKMNRKHLTLNAREDAVFILEIPIIPVDFVKEIIKHFSNGF
jgi:hypothetical protein